ncbi:MAG TPA: hypothetical protein VHM69_11205 [Rubrobacter sp.]|nr:hypothetical protein [Rubrobacter sp.]
MMSRSERVYWLLLLAYPREFRRDCGVEMAQVFGDLCREEKRRSGAFGLMRAWVRTVPDLVSTAFAERVRGKDEEVYMQDRRLAVIGFVLLLAPLYFVSASLLKYGLGVGFLFDPLEAFLSVAGRREIFNLISPVVFLGGLGLALALNTYAVTRLDVSREDGTVVSTVRVKLELWNIAVAVVSILLLVTLIGYVFLENFTYRH